jgi:hypothetical protein
MPIPVGRAEPDPLRVSTTRLICGCLRNQREEVQFTGKREHLASINAVQKRQPGPSLEGQDSLDSDC